jgi:hypothetical protein
MPAIAITASPAADIHVPRDVTRRLSSPQAGDTRCKAHVHLSGLGPFCGSELKIDRLLMNYPEATK